MSVCTCVCVRRGWPSTRALIIIPLSPSLYSHTQPPATSCASFTGTATWTTVPPPGRVCGIACLRGRSDIKRTRTRQWKSPLSPAQPTRCGACARLRRRRAGGRRGLGTWMVRPLSPPQAPTTRRPRLGVGCTQAAGRRRRKEERGGRKNEENNPTHNTSIPPLSPPALPAPGASPCP